MSDTQQVVVNTPPRALRAVQNLGSEPGKRHLTQLDGVRAVAIVAVLWSHWGGKYTFGLPWGTGVQLFFVLSGFLITSILLDQREAPNLFRAWRRFYARRTLRIFPLFYVTILVTLIFNLPPIRQTWPWHVFYLSNLHFVLQGGFDPYPSCFNHFWSLAVEEQFYFVWPFLALFLPFASLRYVFPTLIVAAPLLRIATHPFISNEFMIHILPWSNLDALGLGGLFAYLSRYSATSGFRARRLAKVCLFVGVPLSLLGVVQSRIPYAIFTLGHTGLVAVFGWFVFSAQQGFKGFLGKILSNKLIVYVGKISYGLYMIHNFAPLLVRSLGQDWNLNSLASGSFVPCFMAQGAFTFAIAICSWHFFEKPINNLKRLVPYN